MFIPGYVENWLILIEASNLGLGSLSNMDVIKKIIKVMSVNFTCTLEKEFIMNPPYIVKKTWNLVESKKFLNS